PGGLRALAAAPCGAAPFGPRVLAALGAEVVKIEDPTVGGDVSRYVPPYQGAGDSLYFQAFNRGKKSLALDLRHPEAAGVLHDLVRVSHAVYNNLRGDLPAKLGLTYETLGRGRDLDVSLLDTAVSMLSYLAIWSLNRDWEPQRVEDGGHQTLVPAQNFRTRDGWIVVFCNKEKFWEALVDALELPELARDP